MIFCQIIILKTFMRSAFFFVVSHSYHVVANSLISLAIII